MTDIFERVTREYDELGDRHYREKIDIENKQYREKNDFIRTNFSNLEEIRQELLKFNPRCISMEENGVLSIPLARNITMCVDDSGRAIIRLYGAAVVDNRDDRFKEIYTNLRKMYEEREEVPSF